VAVDGRKAGVVQQARGRPLAAVAFPADGAIRIEDYGRRARPLEAASMSESTGLPPDDPSAVQR